MKKRFSLFCSLILSLVATASAVQSNTPFLEEPGEGELTTWSRSSINVMVLPGLGIDFSGPDYGGAVNMVTAPDGTVWIDYFIGGFDTNGWTIGKIEGDRMTIPLPQVIYQEDGMSFYLGVINKIDNDTYELGNETEVVFTKDGTVWKSSLETSSKFLGLVNSSGSFQGAGDYRLRFAAFDIPEPGNDEGVEYRDYSFISGESGHIVGVGEKDNKIYVKGLLESYPDSFITGEINGDKVSFKSSQYLGIRDIEGSTPHYNFMTAVKETIDETFVAEESLVFIMNSDKSIFESDGSFVYNHTLSSDFINFTTLCEKPRLVLRKEGERLIPANPTQVTLGIAVTDLSMIAYIPQLSTTGILLDPAQLYYRVYVNGEPFTFYNDEYKYLDMEEMTEIPYTYSESFDFFVKGTYHEIYFYIPEIDVVGVQSIYYGDGYETVSDIVNSDGTVTSGIENIEGTESIAKLTEYFDLLGRRVSSESNGILIKREINQDGTTKTVKLMK